MTPIPLKKITVADVMKYGKAKDWKLIASEGFVQLMWVYGAVADALVKPSKFDANQQVLIGRFECVRVEDRQIFTGQQLYLADKNHQNALAQVVNKARESGEVIEPEFAFMIGYQPGNSPQGYVFSEEPMTDTRVQDRLSSVRKLLNEGDLLKRFNLPALAAPVDIKSAVKK
jgi:hypothetical protein